MCPQGTTLTKSGPSFHAAMTPVGVSVPGITTTFCFTANSTVSGSRPSLERNFAPASRQRRAVSTSWTLPAPTITSGVCCTTCAMTLIASGTVNVTSRMGIPPRAIASAAKSASSVVDTRMEGMIPSSSIRFRTTCLFNDVAPWATGAMFAHELFSQSGANLGVESGQRPRAHRLAQLLQSEQVRGQGLPVGKLRSPVAALGIQKIEQAGASVPVGIFADVARPRGRIQIPRNIQQHHLVIGSQALIGVVDIGEGLTACRFL